MRSARSFGGARGKPPRAPFFMPAWRRTQPLSDGGPGCRRGEPVCRGGGPLEGAEGGLDGVLRRCLLADGPLQRLATASLRGECCLVLPLRSGGLLDVAVAERWRSSRAAAAQRRRSALGGKRSGLAARARAPCSTFTPRGCSLCAHRLYSAPIPGVDGAAALRCDGCGAAYWA